MKEKYIVTFEPKIPFHFLPYKTFVYGEDSLLKAIWLSLQSIRYAKQITFTWNIGE